MLSPAPGPSGVTLYWIQSYRDPYPHTDVYERQVLGRCRDACAAVGMELRVVSVDDVVVAQRGGDRAVVVEGRRISPRSAFFHTKFVSWPAYETDAWRHLTTYEVLEAAGFCVTVPALHSILGNDKLLSVLGRRGCGVPAVPTVRLCTRGIDARGLDPAVWGLDFPLVVKPSSWGGGMAVFVVHGRAELAAVLQLAGAGELTVVLQPWLGPGVVDVRVYCVDGEPYAALSRTAVAPGAAGNVAQGGRGEMTEVPEALDGPARRIARAVGLPYVCADFLTVGGRYWFSELELDGGTGTGGPELTRARFGAYRTRFERFLADPGTSGRWRYV
ncbi:ATP-grasp domain-containing protein [Streptomyces sp. NPDC004031]